MKSWIGFSFLILFGTLCSNAQASKGEGLHLTGTIVGLHAVSECGGTDGRILVTVELSMQFRNSGERPLIVFKPQSRWPGMFKAEMGSTRVLFLRSLPSTSDKESERVQAQHVQTNDCRNPSDRSYSNYDPVGWFIQSIKKPSPVAEYCEIIEPRAYYEFREVVTLDTGFEVDVKAGRSLREARTRSEFPAFQIQYHLSLKGHRYGDGLLQDLQSKWKSAGNFILDGNGDITVTSDPIINRTFE